MIAATAPTGVLAANYARDRIALAALWLLAALLLAAMAAPWLAPQNPYDLAQLDILDAKLAPGAPGRARYTYWLGSDDQGRDMLSAILYGLRISLGVGVASTVLALGIGTVAGLAAARAGGAAPAPRGGAGAAGAAPAASSGGGIWTPGGGGQAPPQGEKKAIWTPGS